MNSTQNRGFCVLLWGGNHRQMARLAIKLMLEYTIDTELISCVKLAYLCIHFQTKEPQAKLDCLHIYYSNVPYQKSNFTLHVDFWFSIKVYKRRHKSTMTFFILYSSY